MGIESTRYHETNVVICKIVTRLTQTPLIETHLPTSRLEHLPDLEEVLQRLRDPILLGDLNMDLDEARRLRNQLVADILTE